MADLNRIGNILNTVLNSGGLQTMAQPQPQQQGFFEQTTPVEQVLKMIGAGVQGYSGQRIQMQEWEKKKTDYYNTLREAGWSAESAANQVHKVYGDFTAPKDGSMSMKELEMESKKVGIEKSRLEKEKLEAEKARGFLKPEKEGEKGFKERVAESFEKGQLHPGFGSMDEQKEYLNITRAEEADYLLTLPPEKRPGSGLFKKGAVSDTTWKVWTNIKTKQDLEELIEKREEYEAAGVDVRKILEYYNPKKKEEK